MNVKSKRKFWQLSLIGISFLFVVALTFGVASAWFEYREKVKGSIEFAPGIIASLGGVDVSEDKEEFYLLKVNNPKRQDVGTKLDITGAMPADEWTIVNPTITPSKDKYGTATAPYVLRARLEFYADNQTECLGDIAVENLIDVMPTYADNWIMGEDGWHYYTTKTRTAGWSNQFASYTEMFINSYNSQAQEQTSVKVFGNTSDLRKLKLSENLEPYTSVKVVLNIEAIQATKDAFDPWALSKSERAITDWNEAIKNMYSYNDKVLFTSSYLKGTDENVKVEAYYTYTEDGDNKTNILSSNEQYVWWTENGVNYKGIKGTSEKWVTTETPKKVLDYLTSIFGLTPAYKQDGRVTYDEAVLVETEKYDYETKFGRSFGSSIFIDGRRYIPNENSYAKSKTGVSTFEFENLSTEEGITISRRYEVTISNGYITNVLYSEENRTASEISSTSYTIIYDELLTETKITEFEQVYSSVNALVGYHVVPTDYSEYDLKVELTINAVVDGSTFNLAKVGEYGNITKQAYGKISYLVDLNSVSDIFSTPVLEDYEFVGYSLSADGNPLLTDESENSGFQYTVGETKTTIYAVYSVILPTEFEQLMTEVRQNLQGYNSSILVLDNDEMIYLNTEKEVIIITSDNINVQKSGNVYYEYNPATGFKTPYTGTYLPLTYMSIILSDTTDVLNQIEAGETNIEYSLETSITKVTYVTNEITRYAEFLNGYLIKDYKDETDNISIYYGTNTTDAYETYADGTGIEYIPENINLVKIGAKLSFIISPIVNAEIKVNGVLITNLQEGKYVAVTENVVLSADSSSYRFVGWKVDGESEYLVDADETADGFQYLMGTEDTTLVAYFEESFDEPASTLALTTLSRDFLQNNNNILCFSTNDSINPISLYSSNNNNSDEIVVNHYDTYSVTPVYPTGPQQTNEKYHMTYYSKSRGEAIIFGFENGLFSQRSFFKIDDTTYEYLSNCNLKKKHSEGLSYVLDLLLYNITTTFDIIENTQTEINSFDNLTKTSIVNFVNADEKNCIATFKEEFLVSIQVGIGSEYELTHYFYYGTDVETAFNRFKTFYQAKTTLTFDTIPENKQEVPVGHEVSFEMNMDIDAQIYINGNQIDLLKSIFQENSVITISATAENYKIDSFTTASGQVIVDCDIETDGFQYNVGTQNSIVKIMFKQSGFVAPTNVDEIIAMSENYYAEFDDSFIVKSISESLITELSFYDKVNKESYLNGEETVYYFTANDKTYSFIDGIKSECDASLVESVLTNFRITEIGELLDMMKTGNSQFNSYNETTQITQISFVNEENSTTYSLTFHREKLIACTVVLPNMVEYNISYEYDNVANKIIDSLVELKNQKTYSEFSKLVPCLKHIDINLDSSYIRLEILNSQNLNVNPTDLEDYELYTIKRSSDVENTITEDSLDFIGISYSENSMVLIQDLDLNKDGIQFRLRTNSQPVNIYAVLKVKDTTNLQVLNIANDNIADSFLIKTKQDDDISVVFNKIILTESSEIVTSYNKYGKLFVNTDDVIKLYNPDDKDFIYYNSDLISVNIEDVFEFENFFKKIFINKTSFSYNQKTNITTITSNYDNHTYKTEFFGAKLIKHYTTDGSLEMDFYFSDINKNLENFNNEYATCYGEKLNLDISDCEAEKKAIYFVLNSSETKVYVNDVLVPICNLSSMGYIAIYKMDSASTLNIRVENETMTFNGLSTNNMGEVDIADENTSLAGIQLSVLADDDLVLFTVMVANQGELISSLASQISDTFNTAQVFGSTQFGDVNYEKGIDLSCVLCNQTTGEGYAIYNSNYFNGILKDGNNYWYYKSDNLKNQITKVRYSTSSHQIKSITNDAVGDMYRKIPQLILAYTYDVKYNEQTGIYTLYADATMLGGKVVAHVKNGQIKDFKSEYTGEVNFCYTEEEFETLKQNLLENYYYSEIELPQTFSDIQTYQEVGAVVLDNSNNKEINFYYSMDSQSGSCSGLSADIICPFGTILTFSATYDGTLVAGWTEDNSVLLEDYDLTAEGFQYKITKSYYVYPVFSDISSEGQENATTLIAKTIQKLDNITGNMLVGTGSTNSGMTGYGGMHTNMLYSQSELQSYIQVEINSEYILNNLDTTKTEEYYLLSGYYYYYDKTTNSIIKRSYIFGTGVVENVVEVYSQEGFDKYIDVSEYIKLYISQMLQKANTADLITVESYDIANGIYKIKCDYTESDYSEYYYIQNNNLIAWTSGNVENPFAETVPNSTIRFFYGSDVNWNNIKKYSANITFGYPGTYPVSNLYNGIPDYYQFEKSPYSTLNIIYDTSAYSEEQKMIVGLIRKSYEFLINIDTSVMLYNTTYNTQTQEVYNLDTYYYFNKETNQLYVYDENEFWYFINQNKVYQYNCLIGTLKEVDGTLQSFISSLENNCGGVQLLTYYLEFVLDNNYTIESQEKNEVVIVFETNRLTFVDNKLITIEFNFEEEISDKITYYIGNIANDVFENFCEQWKVLNNEDFFVLEDKNLENYPTESVNIRFKGLYNNPSAVDVELIRHTGKPYTASVLFENPNSLELAVGKVVTFKNSNEYIILEVYNGDGGEQIFDYDPDIDGFQFMVDGNIAELNFTFVETPVLYEFEPLEDTSTLSAEQLLLYGALQDSFEYYENYEGNMFSYYKDYAVWLNYYYNVSDAILYTDCEGCYVWEDESKTYEVSLYEFFTVNRSIYTKEQCLIETKNIMIFEYIFYALDSLENIQTIENLNGVLTVNFVNGIHCKFVDNILIEYGEVGFTNYYYSGENCLEYFESVFQVDYQNCWGEAFPVLTEKNIDYYAKETEVLSIINDYNDIVSIDITPYFGIKINDWQIDGQSVNDIELPLNKVVTITSKMNCFVFAGVHDDTNDVDLVDYDLTKNGFQFLFDGSFLEISFIFEELTEEIFITDCQSIIDSARASIIDKEDNIACIMQHESGELRVGAYAFNDLYINGPYGYSATEGMGYYCEDVYLVMSSIWAQNDGDVHNYYRYFTDNTSVVDCNEILVKSQFALKDMKYVNEEEIVWSILDEITFDNLYSYEFNKGLLIISAIGCEFYFKDNQLVKMIEMTEDSQNIYYYYYNITSANISDFYDLVQQKLDETGCHLNYNLPDFSEIVESEDFVDKKAIIVLKDNSCRNEYYSYAKFNVADQNGNNVYGLWTDYNMFGNHPFGLIFVNPDITSVTINYQLERDYNVDKNGGVEVFGFTTDDLEKYMFKESKGDIVPEGITYIDAEKTTTTDYEYTFILDLTTTKTIALVTYLHTDYPV